MKILEKKPNPLLSRTEIKAEIEYTGATPSNNDVKNELAKQLSADVNLVVVKQILPIFGLRKSTVNAYLYDSKEALMKIERIKETKPKTEEKPKEDAKPEEGSTEKPKEEKPAEAKE